MNKRNLKRNYSPSIRKDNKTNPERNNDTNKKTKKKEKRKFNKVAFLFFLKLFLVISLLSAIISFIYTYEAFEIRYSNINGYKYANYKSIENIIKSRYGKNIFALNKGALEKNIDNLVEVKDTKIKRKFPNTLNVKITEFTPIVCFKTPYNKLLIDSDGYIFHKVNEKDKISNIPIVASTNIKLKTNRNINDSDDFHTIFLYELSKACYDNNLNIKGIKIKNSFSVVMYTNDNTLIKFGATADIPGKVNLLKHIMIKKRHILKDMKEIYIIDDKTATYKLKTTTPDNTLISNKPKT